MNTRTLIKVLVGKYGKGLREVGKDSTGRVIVKMYEAFYRPMEAGYLLGDSSKVANVLKWTPKTSFFELVRVMAEADLATLSRNITR